jgi:D-sedoheptulose 7-phosphate isomerase
MKSYHENYFQSIHGTLADSLYSIKNQIVDKEILFNELIEATKEIKKKNGKIYFFGNGASASFANHMALDWSKNGKIISYSLSDSAFLTALSNDYNFESVFKEYLVINNICENDLIVTISSSGNSGNVIGALNYCKDLGIKTLALSGLKPNNKSVELAHYSIYVPRKTYGIVECSHQIFLHLWLDNYMEIYEWERDTFQNMNIDNYKI